MRNALTEIQREETRMRSSAEYRLLSKLLTFQSTTTLQHWQIDLCVRGWIGAFATLAAYAIPISSRTMCAQSSESEYYSPKRTANIIRL